jgi:hypothetical protein
MNHQENIMAKSYPTTSASAVSARLHKAGFAIVATRKLQGIRVSRGILGSVSVEVDLDVPRQETRLANLVEEELKTWEGYTYRRTSNGQGSHFYISKAEDQ